MNEAQAVGCLVGLAIGDALGYPAEFRRRAQLLREFPPHGLTDFVAIGDQRFSRPFFTGRKHPPGTYTDDTQMMIAVAEALLTAGQFDLEQLMPEMGRRFVAWSHSEKNDRAPGQTCMRGCANLAAGRPWRQAGIADSKGCGSAMRAAPMGIFYEDLDQIEHVARASSLLTHGHPAALEGAAAAALLVALAARGWNPADMFAEIERRCSPNSSDFAAVWRKVPEVLHLPPESVLLDDVLGEAWVADEAVASAMYCFWRSPDSYEQAVLTAINTDGDSDTIGAITGSLVGARVGIEAIPRRWRAQVEDSEYLHELGKRLWESGWRAR